MAVVPEIAGLLIGAALQNSPAGEPDRVDVGRRSASDAARRYTRSASTTPTSTSMPPTISVHRAPYVSPIQPITGAPIGVPPITIVM